MYLGIDLGTSGVKVVLAQRVEAGGLDPQPVPGRQEWLENLVARSL